MRRIAIILSAALVILLSIVTPALASPVFSDVPSEDAELTAACAFLHDLGFVRGYPDGTLRPHQALTKGQGALILTRAAPYARDYSPWFGNQEPAMRGWVRAWLPALSWHEARWDGPLTRGQAVRLLYRYIYGV